MCEFWQASTKRIQLSRILFCSQETSFTSKSNQHMLSMAPVWSDWLFSPTEGVLKLNFHSWTLTIWWCNWRGLTVREFWQASTKRNQLSKILFFQETSFTPNPTKYVLNGPRMKWLGCFTDLNGVLKLIFHSWLLTIWWCNWRGWQVRGFWQASTKRNQLSKFLFFQETSLTSKHPTTICSQWPQYEVTGLFHWLKWDA